MFALFGAANSGRGLSDAMSITAIVRALVAAGASPEMILAAVEAAEASQQDVLASRRATDAARQRKHRERNAMSRDVTATERDSPSPEVSPAPLPNPNPSKNPPKGGQKGSRLPVDWQPDEVDWQEATSQGYSRDQAQREFDKFRDHWIGKSGKDAFKLDWRATLRNWLRNSTDWRRSPVVPSSGKARDLPLPTWRPNRAAG